MNIIITISLESNDRWRSGGEKFLDNKVDLNLVLNAFGVIWDMKLFKL